MNIPQGFRQFPRNQPAQMPHRLRIVAADAWLTAPRQNLPFEWERADLRVRDPENGRPRRWASKQVQPQTHPQSAPAGSAGTHPPRGRPENGPGDVAGQVTPKIAISPIRHQSRNARARPTKIPPRSAPPTGVTLPARTQSRTCILNSPQGTQSKSALDPGKCPSGIVAGTLEQQSTRLVGQRHSTRSERTRPLSTRRSAHPGQGRAAPSAP